MNRIKFINHPDFLHSEWQTRNPLLENGEIAFIKDESGRTINQKVGPGFYNDLPFFGGTYPYIDAPTNEIGDAKGVLTGKTSIEIIRLMLNPYKAVVVSGSRNNGGIVGGTYENTIIREIGDPVVGNVLLQYNLANSVNLLGGSPININSGGVFNDGNFANGPITLVPQATINPTLPTTIVINVKAAHSQGFSNIDKTYLSYFPKAIWGSSESADLSAGSEVNALLDKGTRKTNTPNGDYNFTRQGYHWIAIPGMLSPNSPAFTDITDPNAPASVGFISKGSLTVNNGVGTYVYQLYRSPFYITQSVSKYRLVNG